MNELSNHRINELTSRWALRLMILAIIGFALLMFRHVLVPDFCLFSTDNNIGQENTYKGKFPACFLGGIWGDTVFLGMPGGIAPIIWYNLLIWLMPIVLYINWVHAIDLGLASLLFAIWLRDRQVGWCAIVVGFLSAFWLGSNLTLTYAGHLGKYGVIMFASAALYCISRALTRYPSMLWSILAGGAIGFMFLEQLDVALFFGFVLGAYALFLAIRQWQADRTWIKVSVALCLMGGMAILMAGSTMLSGYESNVKGTVSMQTGSAQEKWEFVTQWSWPPEECIDFIAPGYMGWRSGEPEGPYWGRMGRSAGWEQTRQGFMNFKLENMYLGIIPVLLALFAVLMTIMGKESQFTVDAPSPASGVRCPASTSPWPFAAERRAEVIFWGCVAAITLLLAFGKFFPLYALFYKLPFVNSIRNPNKFLQIFQLALGILAAYGLDGILRDAGKRTIDDGRQKTRGR